MDIPLQSRGCRQRPLTCWCESKTGWGYANRTAFADEDIIHRSGHAKQMGGRRRYLGLGIEHILLGYDHLLFVLALVILVRTWPRVAITVTAFTVAHRITLAAATLGFVNVPGPPVEAAIALSIVLVAVEIVNARRGISSLTARWPWLVAFFLVSCMASVLPVR